MELTKEHFDQAIKGLATQQSVDDLASRMATMESLLAGQATSLDAIAKDVKDWNAEMTLMRNRMERYESALRVVAGKLNLDINPLLH